MKAIAKRRSAREFARDEQVLLSQTDGYPKQR